MKAYACFIFLALLVYSCVEPYQPEVGAYDSTLVVDGIFTDGADTSTVVLSRSYPYTSTLPEFLTGATVIIEDEQGNRTELTETAPGKYQNDPAVFTGQVGVRYRLLVSLPEGGQFESDWETLKAAPPIGNVYFEYQERNRDNPDRAPISGLQLFLDTKDPENKTRYYRWQYEETYQYTLTYPPFIEVKFGNPPARGRDTIFDIPFREQEGRRCWKTVASTRLLLASTEDFTEDVVEAYPLHFVDDRTPRLYIRYSLLVRQYAISKNYHEYLRSVEAVNQTTGSLFDPIPTEVFGNVHSADGRDIPVLGYFAVAGSQSERYFIDRSELPIGLSPPYGPVCVSDTISTSFRELYNETRFGNKVLHNYVYNMFGTLVGYELATPECARCAASEATNVQPEFW